MDKAIDVITGMQWPTQRIPYDGNGRFYSKVGSTAGQTDKSPFKTFLQNDKQDIFRHGRNKGNF